MAARTRKSRILKGDRVMVISGNDRGQSGTVLRVVEDGMRVVVEGVAVRKRHQRPTQADQDGGIMSIEQPIHVSNVMLIDPATGDPTRVRTQIDSDGMKERVAVKSGNPVPKP